MRECIGPCSPAHPVLCKLALWSVGARDQRIVSASFYTTPARLLEARSPTGSQQVNQSPRPDRLHNGSGVDDVGGRRLLCVMSLYFGTPTSRRDEKWSEQLDDVSPYAQSKPVKRMSLGHEVETGQANRRTVDRGNRWGGWLLAVGVLVAPSLSLFRIRRIRIDYLDHPRTGNVRSPHGGHRHDVAHP